jgi:hypothetical protein
MRLIRIAVVAILVALCAQTLGLAAGFTRSGQQVTGSHFRFTVLSPTLVRLEHSASNAFVDERTVLIQNRNWPACKFSVSESNGALVIDTGKMQVRYRPDGGFGPDNLAIAWTAGGAKQRWQPGQRDAGNLGGTRGALDGIGAGNLPPLDPGLLSRSGYTLLEDNKAIWRGWDGWLAERPDKGAQDWYFFVYGHDYRHFLQEYVDLAGKIPMLPEYALGAWYSRYWPYKDTEEKGIVNRFRADHIPLDVLVIDVDWHLYGWESYDWNTTLFPDPQGFLDWVHAQGVKVTLNNHPGAALPVEDTHHAEASRIAGEDPTKAWNWDLGKKAHATAFQEAVHWPLEKMGVDFWWIDGCAGTQFDNINSDQWCAQVYYDGTQRRTGKRSLVFSRYGGLGQHRSPGGFSGDVHSEWDVLNYEVRYTARAGNVLFPYWSHDIGGFLGDKIDPELYVRWCQFGALSPVLRLHSNHGVREPWNYGTWNEQIVGDYFRLRERLYPYLNTLTRTVHDTGTPMCRPLYLQWPEAPEAYTYDYEYMLGSEMLVAPVAVSGHGGPASKDIWFPPGVWVDYWTGETYRGPQTIVYSAPLQRAPMFVRAGGIIPMQPEMPYIGQKPADPLTLDMYAGADGAFSLYEDDGTSLDYGKGSYTTTPIRLRFAGGDAEVSVGGAKGAYAGQPTQRSLVARLNCIAMPERVLVDGVPLKQTPGLPKEAPPVGTWAFDHVRSRAVISLPSRPVQYATTVTFVGVGDADVQQLRGEAQQLQRLVATATHEVRFVDIMARLKHRSTTSRAVVDALAGAERQTEAAASATRGARATTGAVRRSLDAARGAVRAAFSVAGGGIANPVLRSSVLRALLGLSSSATLDSGAPGTMQVTAVLGVNEWARGCRAEATPIMPAEWPLRGNAGSDFGAFAQTGHGQMTYSLTAPGAMQTPPLGLLTFGANVRLTLGGVALDVPVMTGLDCSFVQQWHVIGPFKYGDGVGIDAPYPPESEIDFTKTYDGLAGPVKWQATSWHLPGTDAASTAAYVNLIQMIPLEGKGAAYAVAYIVSDADKEAVLSVGSDDGCIVWLNGERVLRSPAPRPATPGEDKVNVNLRKGANTVLFKVAQEGGEWGLYLQVLGRDMMPLPGLTTTLARP